MSVNKIVTTEYECPLCKSRYLSEDEAIECERSHANVDKITECIYYKNRLSDGRYPYKVEIKFSDGTFGVYDCAGLRK